jgi:hypothetical protein
LAICSLIACLSKAYSAENNICEKEMLKIADANQVPVGVLYAVALTETGQRGELHAYAMNIAGRAVFNTDLAEALRVFDMARKEGVNLIDIGCMQINHYYHGKAFVSVADMFDPHRNVEYAALFLKRLRQTEGSWTAAVARYHAGPGNLPAQKSYVCAVIRNMVTSGFGGWTEESRAFCDG